VNRHFRENLVIHSEGKKEWIQCAKCFHTLSPIEEDWKEGCKVSLVSPDVAGPHRERLKGRFMFEQRYCPGCGVLLEATLVEVNANAG
jgi:hypothetical protein